MDAAREAELPIATAGPTTGLNSETKMAYKSGASRKARQTLAPDRSAVEWQCVTITAEHAVNAFCSGLCVSLSSWRAS